MSNCDKCQKMLQELEDFVEIITGIGINQDTPAEMYVPVNLPDGSICIFGESHGVHLFKRGANDNHICYRWLTEDDGWWYIEHNDMGSSCWVSEDIKILEALQEFFQKECTPDMYEGKQYGWRFKPKEV